MNKFISVICHLIIVRKQRKEGGTTDGAKDSEGEVEQELDGINILLQDLRVEIMN